MTEKSEKKTPKKSPGRKPIYGEKMMLINFFVTESMRDKYLRNGGSAWLRKLIEEAPDTASEKKK